MSTPTTTSTIQNSRLFNVEFKQSLPTALSLKISTACAGSVTRNSSSIPYPATHTIRSVSSTTSGTVSRALRARPSGRRRSPAASCARPARAAGTGRPGRRFLHAQAVRCRGRGGRARRAAIAGTLRQRSHSPAGRAGFRRQRRNPASGSAHLTWNRQRILEKVRDLRGATRPRVPAGLPVKTSREPDAFHALARRVDRRRPSGAVRLERSLDVAERDRPPPATASVIARQSDGAAQRQREAPPALGDVHLVHAVRVPGPRPDARAVPRRRRPSRPSTATPRAPDRPRRPARRRSDGLNRASSSGSSSARTRLRGMLTSSFDSSSTNGSPRVGEVRARSRAPAVEQRTDDRAATRMHRREAARARAAQQTEQERLGLIVARVAERDDVGAESGTRARSKNAWRAVARRVLDRAALAPRARRRRPRDRRSSGTPSDRRQVGDRTARRRPPRRAADG